MSTRSTVASLACGAKKLSHLHAKPPPLSRTTVRGNWVCRNAEFQLLSSPRKRGPSCADLSGKDSTLGPGSPLRSGRDDKIDCSSRLLSRKALQTPKFPTAQALCGTPRISCPDSHALSRGQARRGEVITRLSSRSRAEARHPGPSEPASAGEESDSARASRLSGDVLLGPRLRGDDNVISTFHVCASRRAIRGAAMARRIAPP
jgi:hypothetical protein